MNKTVQVVLLVVVILGMFWLSKIATYNVIDHVVSGCDDEITVLNTRIDSLHSVINSTVTSEVITNE